MLLDPFCPKKTPTNIVVLLGFMSEFPGVRWVLPDSQEDVENKQYGCITFSFVKILQFIRPYKKPN